MKRYLEIIDKFLPTKKIMSGLKNASYLTVGHFLSMGISFIGLIYIARLLGPKDYGIYATVGAFVGIFDLITIYGINKVVLREGAKDLSKMHLYLEKTTGIKNFFAFIAIGACIVLSSFTPYSIQIKLYIILFSFSLIYNAFNPFLNTIYKAAEKMQYIAILQILNVIVYVSLSVTFLYLGYGLLTLFLIALFSHFLTIIINYKLSKRFIKFKFWSKINWDKNLLKPALVFSILSFSYFLAGRIDILMISILGTSREVGIYGIASQITLVGVTTRTIVATAFFPIFVKAFSSYVVKWRSLLRYSIVMGIGLLTFAAIISFYSNQIISLFFGEKYYESGVILGVLIFQLAILFFDIPFSNTLQATYNENKLLKICWIAPVINICLNYILYYRIGLIGIAYSTLVVTCVSLLLYILLTWQALKKSRERNLK